MNECYAQCADIPWYKFGQRRLCEQQCDLEAFQINQDEIQQTLTAENASKRTLYTWLFVTLIILILLVVAAKYFKWI